MNNNVKLGENCKIGEFVIIGETPENTETTIGNNANIRSHSIIYAGNKIGDNFSTGHRVFLRENNEIGNDVSIGTNSIIEHNVKIGNNVRIHSGVFIPEYSVLEDNCWIGPKAVFTNANHPRCSKVKECLKGPLIKKGAKIGANSTLMPHITVGENAVVGAGSVVTKDVPAGKVVVGNPAKIIKDVSELKCKFGRVEKPY